MFTELAPGVHVFGSRFVEAKYGIILGARRSLIVDIPYFEDESRAMAQFVLDHGGTPNRIQFTHGHGDHVLGAGVFDGAEVFASVLTPDVMRYQMGRWTPKDGTNTLKPLERALWPTVLTDGGITHDLGDFHARVFAAPGHSADGQSVLLEEPSILFAGDTATTGIVPAIEWGDSRILERAQRALAELNVETLVPGHGDIVRGRTEVRDWLVWMADYLAGTRDAIREGLQRGESRPEIDARANYERCVGARFDPSRNGMTRRHANTITAMLKELA